MRASEIALACSYRRIRNDQLVRTCDLVADDKAALIASKDSLLVSTASRNVDSIRSMARATARVYAIDGV